MAIRELDAARLTAVQLRDISDQFVPILTSDPGGLGAGLAVRVVSAPAGAGGGGVAQTQVRDVANVWADVGYFAGNQAMPVNVVAGGAGGGTAQLAVRDATDAAWTNVGPSAARARVPVESYVGTTAVDPRAIRALTSSDQVTVANASIAVTGTFWQVTQPVSGTFWATTAGSPSSTRLSDGAAFYDARSIRALTSADVVTANQGTPAALANRWPVELQTGAATTYDARQIRTLTTADQVTPIQTNAANLQVWAYGNVGSFQQRAVSLDLYVAERFGGAEIDPRSIRALTTADAVNVGQWIGSAAPTVGSKTGANSIPVVIASDQADLGVKQATAANLNVRTDDTGATAAAVPARGNLPGVRAATAMPTATADGQLTALLGDKYGRLVTADAPEDLWGQGRATITTNTSTSILAAAGAGVKWAVSTIAVTKTLGTTAGRLDILDGATLIHSFAFVQTAITAGEPQQATVNFLVPYKGTANTAINAQSSVALTDWRVVVTGFKTIL